MNTIEPTSGPVYVGHEKRAQAVRELTDTVAEGRKRIKEAIQKNGDIKDLLDPDTWFNFLKR